MRKSAVFPLLILTASLAISLLWYARSLSVGFLADDYDFLEHVTAAETQPNPVWSLASSSIGGASFFRPIINISFWVDYKLFGHQAAGYHFSNILFFGLSVGIVVLLMEKLTKHKLTAYAAGLFFLVNPFASESVSWIAGRTDLLMLLGLLFTLYAFSQYRSNYSKKWLVFFFLGSIFTLFSKENGLVFLPLVFIIDFFFFRDWSIIQSNIKNARALLSFCVPYASAFFAVAIFFYARRSILGFLFANTNSFGNSYFSYPALSDLRSFFQLLTINILSNTGYAWLPVKKIIFLGTYGISFILALIVFFGLFVKGFRLFLMQLFFGIAFTMIIALPVAGFFSFIGPDHSNIRFLYVPMVGLAITFGLFFGPQTGRFRRTASIISFLLILVVWSVGSWQGQSRFVLARNQLENVYLSFKQQIQPALDPIARPGLLLANLPGLRNGVHITPANIGYALSLRFPDEKKAEVQMYGIVPIQNSLLCQLENGARVKDSLLSFVWKNNEFIPIDIPGRFLASPVNKGVPLSSTTTGMADTAFPFVVISDYKLSWADSDQPFNTSGLHRMVIPIQSDNSLLTNGQPHIRFGFSETTQIKTDDIIALPITQAMLDQGMITLNLCQYPRFYQSSDHRAFSWEWRNLENLAITINEPKFE